jgi:pyridoxal phosphate phosphatase PHOSPHO2
MADQDTDRWIFEVLAPDIRRKMKTLKESVQWTDLMSVLFTFLSNQPHT